MYIQVIAKMREKKISVGIKILLISYFEINGD